MKTPTTYHELFNLLSRKDIPFVRPNAEGEITIEDAQKLFQAFSQLEDLYFQADDNGCWERCTLMQNLLMAAGVKAATIMADNHGVSPEENPKMATWDYHFAPGVFLQNTSDLIMIDPTCAEEPVDLEAWRQEQGVCNKSIIIVTDGNMIGTDKTEKHLGRIQSLAQQQSLRAA